MKTNDLNDVIEKLGIPRPEDKDANVLVRASYARNQLLHRQPVPIDAKSTTTHERLPEGHPAVTRDTNDSRKCPFAPSAALEPTVLQRNKSEISRARRPESLPTPPETSRHLDEEGLECSSVNKSPSPPPSIPASISKCPIRMLDERPAQEIAEYFESHKHEIPRSHEICVKRYQSNAQSIRLLDAKYGNLANMIQGLGMKHQPMLPGKEFNDGAKARSRLDDPIGDWAHHVPASSDKQEPFPIQKADDDEREGYFERPMKEIRVGESPSRPWGIRVPEEESVRRADSQNVHAGTTSPHQMPLPMHSTSDSEPLPRERTKSSRRKSSHMHFTGPVFIGYPPEQAAALLSQIRTSYQADP